MRTSPRKIALMGLAASRPVEEDDIALLRVTQSVHPAINALNRADELGAEAQPEEFTVAKVEEDVRPITRGNEPEPPLHVEMFDGALFDVIVLAQLTHSLTFERIHWPIANRCYYYIIL